MLFRNIIASVAFVGAVTAFVLPNSARQASSPIAAVDERSQWCSNCGSGPGSGISSTITTTVQVDAGLRTFTNAQLLHADSVLGVFADISSSTDLEATVDAVLSVGAGLYTWNAADLTTLTTALTAYVGGSIDTNVAIFVQAGIDVEAFSAIYAGYLQTFITTCVGANLALSATVKTDICLYVQQSICTAHYSCSLLQTTLQTYISSLTAVVAVASLHLNVASATCISAAAALKLSLQAYVKSCVSTSGGGLLGFIFKTLSVTISSLVLVTNAWVGGSFGSLAGSVVGLLGINLSTSSDLQICVRIVNYLLSCNSKFDFSAFIGLDLSVYSSVFSSIVA